MPVSGLHEMALAKRALTPNDAYAASEQTGDAIDTQGYEWACYFFILGTTQGTLAFKITECATSGGSYSDISGAAVTGLGTGDDETVYVVAVRLRSKDRLQYHKVSFTPGTSAAAGAVLCLLVPLGGELPVSQDNTVVVA